MERGQRSSCPGRGPEPPNPARQAGNTGSLPDRRAGGFRGGLTALERFFRRDDPGGRRAETRLRRHPAPGPLSREHAALAPSAAHGHADFRSDARSAGRTRVHLHDTPESRPDDRRRNAPAGRAGQSSWLAVTYRHLLPLPRRPSPRAGRGRGALGHGHRRNAGHQGDQGSRRAGDGSTAGHGSV